MRLGKGEREVKKALLSRFENNTERCKHIIDKYFSDLENVHQHLKLVE